MCTLFPQISFGLDAKSCPTLATPRTVAWQATLSMGFSSGNTGVGCLFPSPEILPIISNNLIGKEN